MPSHDRLDPFWFHLVWVSTDWVKVGGVGSLPGSSTLSAPQLPRAVTPPLASVEGRDSCSALALEGWAQGWAPLTAQGFQLCLHQTPVSTKYSPINVTPQATPCSPSLPLPPSRCMWSIQKGQGPVPCDPLCLFEVHSLNLGDNLPWVWNCNYKQQWV